MFRCTTALLACLFVSGCQVAYFLTPEKGQPVNAEYTKIGRQRVAVVVWADRPTLDMDPKARRRVCDAVVYDMKKHLTDAKFVSVRQIEDFQERSGLDWERMNNGEVCKKLECDVLIRVDLLDYTTRAAETRELRKGRVRGTVNLYECAVETQEAAYHTEVAITYPGQKDKPLTDLTDGELLRETAVQFGQAVAQKFYDHEVSYHGPEKR